MGAGPLRGPAVEFAFAAVEPVHVHGDRDGRLVVLDVVPPVLTAPLVRGVLDGLAVHTQVSNVCSSMSRG